MAGSEQGHAHGHGHFHEEDLDWEEMGPYLERNAEVTTQWTDEAVTWLRDLMTGTPVRRVLDIGSGPGVTTGKLAAAFPDAEVVAVDGEPALLERARDRASRLGLGDRVRTHTADLSTDLADAGTADLIWTSHVMHHLGDQRAAVARLAARLNPGGLLAVAEGGLPHRYLPRDLGFGRPGLEARLDALLEDWFTDMRASLPGAVTEVDDWPDMLRTAALADQATRTFLAEVLPPLNEPARSHIIHAFERAQNILQTALTEDDRQTLTRLLNEHDPQSLHHRQDLKLLTANTVHTARRR